MCVSCFTFGVRQFGVLGRTLVAAVGFVPWNASLAGANSRLEIDARVAHLVQRNDSQDLVLLRVGHVQVAVGGRDAQVVLVRDLSRTVTLHQEIFVKSFVALNVNQYFMIRLKIT